MLSSAARCSVPLHPGATIPWPRRRWHCNLNHTLPPTAVSAKARRWSRGPRRDRSWGDDGGGSDSDVDDGFFGPEDEEDEEEAEQEEPAPGRSALAAPQLRGSDVLRALQRAAAAKEAARKMRTDKKPAARQRQGKQRPEGRDVEDGEVRPVVVRPEWAARIRELELRVQQLIDEYHH